MGLADFLKGFGHCERTLQAAIFEASHTYRLAGRGISVSSGEMMR